MTLTQTRPSAAPFHPEALQPMVVTPALFTNVAPVLPHELLEARLGRALAYEAAHWHEPSQAAARSRARLERRLLRGAL